MASLAVLDEAINLPLAADAVTLLALHANVELPEPYIIVSNALVVVWMDWDVAVDLLG